MRRGALLLVAVLTGALVPVAAPALNACAAEGPRAALVVDTGNDVHRYCVALPDDSVSGIDLIVLANEQYGLTYRFGYGGNAVCMLAEVGTTGDDCWAEYPDFWGYWRGTGDGDWTWSSSGAHATTVTDGDVEGWAWGAGDGPSSHPSPPSTRFADICEVASPAEGDGGGGTPPDTGSHPKTQAPSSGGAPPPPTTDDADAPAMAGESGRGADGLGAREKKEKRETDRRSERSESRGGGRYPRSDDSERSGGAERVPSAAPSAGEVEAPSGIPGGALLSLGLVGAFGAGGVFINRRRRAG